MIKYIFGLFLSLSFLCGEKLIIDANSFESNDLKNITIFKGNVKLEMSSDKLGSDKIEIYSKMDSLSKKKKFYKYIAFGNVKFEILAQKKVYKGRGDKLTYNLESGEYTIIGNAFLEETMDAREIYGDTISINKLTSIAKVKGSDKKPIRFILNMESGNKSK